MNNLTSRDLLIGTGGALFLMLMLLLFASRCLSHELKCTYDIEVHYLNSATDTIHFETKSRQVGLSKDGCVTSDWKNYACFVTKFRVLKQECK